MNKDKLRKAFREGRVNHLGLMYVQCPSCAKRLKVMPKASKVWCPKCNKVMTTKPAI